MRAAGPVLVTGAGGMVGGAVAEALAARGVAPALHAGRAEGGLDEAGVAEGLITRSVPACVIHCAGLTYGTPDQLWASNALAAMRLLDAVARHAPAARVVLVGSSAEYGLTGPGEFLGEDSPCRPDSEYGMSKLAATRIAALSPVATVVARLFNPVPALPDPRTLLGRVARGYSEGRREPAGAGEVRDFVALEQVGTALVALGLDAADPGPAVVNLCTGVARSAAEQLGHPAPAAPGRWSVGDARLMREVLGPAAPGGGGGGGAR